jgi:hypothetical protein
LTENFFRPTFFKLFFKLSSLERFESPSSCRTAGADSDLDFLRRKLRFSAFSAGLELKALLETIVRKDYYILEAATELSHGRSSRSTAMFLKSKLN